MIIGKVPVNAVTGEVGSWADVRLSDYHVQVNAAVSAKVRFCSAIHETLLSSEPHWRAVSTCLARLIGAAA